MMRRIAALPVIAGLTLMACAPAPVLRTVPADLEVGRLAHRTAFETGTTQAQAEPTEAPGPAPAPVDDAPARSADAEKQQLHRTRTFWAGIALTAIGGAGVVALAATGQITQNQLAKGYDEGSLTHADERSLRDRGVLVNRLAIASGAVTIVGTALALIAYGIDYTRCGDLARKRKKCRDAR